jgi:formylglycine-generating enzyme required for sulfatase activity
MGANPSYFTNDPARPVEQVSWNDAHTFLAKLNADLGATAAAPAESEDATAGATDASAADAATTAAPGPAADASSADASAAAPGPAADASSAGASAAAPGPAAQACRLPSEAEWEYACRAGTTGAYGGTGVLADMGWTIPDEGEPVWARCLAAGKNDEVIAFLHDRARSGGYQTRAVKLKAPNAWGLYDMHGNVWQWCEDAYRPYDTSSDSAAAIDADADHPKRVARGGAWSGPASFARSASRTGEDPAMVDWAFGFRLAASAEVEQGP